MEACLVIRFLSFILAFKLVVSLHCNASQYEDIQGNCLMCPDHCQFCNSNDRCFTCVNGYWGNVCEKFCDKCKEGTSCAKSTGFCNKDCKDGYTGEFCDDKCSEMCSSCNRMDAQICLNCAHGWYPPVSCHKSCPDGCFNRSCSAKGVCINACKNGFHGQLCELRCLGHCKGNLCHQGNGTCVHGCEGKFIGTNCDKDEKTGNTATVVVVVVILVLVLVFGAVIAGLIVVRRKRRRLSRFSTPEEAKEMLPIAVGRSSETTNTGTSKKEKTEDSSQTQSAVRIIWLKRLCFCVPCTEQTYTNMMSPEADPLCTETDTPVPATKTKEQKLQDTVNRIKTKTDEDLDDEFSKLPVAVPKSHNRSLKKENATAMEKEGVFPYDENIVTVRGRNGEELYVNASFIQDKGRNAYIASREPIRPNHLRMWRLLWQNDCTTVVTLNTSEKEKKKKKALINFRELKHYWPSEKEKQSYDKMSVSRVDNHKPKLENEDCIIRLFKLEKGKETKVVKQLQYTGWPEKDVPDKHNLLEFITKVRDAHLEGGGPIVVHGRRGVGRTGTFIALDILMKEVDDLLNSDEDETIDVFHCVKNLRQQRTLMVENSKQYKFLHEALKEYTEALLQKYESARNENTVTPKEDERNTEIPKGKDEGNTETPNEKDKRNTETPKEKNKRNTARTKQKNEKITQTPNKNKETPNEKDQRNTKPPNENKETPKEKDQRNTKPPNENKETERQRAGRKKNENTKQNKETKRPGRKKQEDTE